MNGSANVRIAILGCGAVTELGHLPAIAALSNARVTLLVDTNEERRSRLAKAFNVDHTASDVHGHYDLFDAAVVALPHALHDPASISLLAQGKSVLVEKPMALTAAECAAMMGAAARTGAVLAVGLMRRFLWSHRFTHLLIEKGILGQISSFDFREGSIYNWPVASDFFFRKEAAGGGVLIDTGAHTLDCLLHWLGDFTDVDYFDDAEGGVDANCLLKLRLRSGACGVVELSRTRQLRNTAIIYGDRGVLEVALGGNNHFKLSMPSKSYDFQCEVANFNKAGLTQSYLQLMTSQVDDFVDAIRSGRPPAVKAPSAEPSIRLIEACYRLRKPLELPWDPQISTRSVEVYES